MFFFHKMWLRWKGKKTHMPFKSFFLSQDPIFYNEYLRKILFSLLQPLNKTAVVHESCKSCLWQRIHYHIYRIYKIQFDIGIIWILGFSAFLKNEDLSTCAFFRKDGRTDCFRKNCKCSVESVDNEFPCEYYYINFT